MRAFQIIPAFLTVFAGLVPGAIAATNAPVTIQVDAAADRHPIHPLIYGVAFATSNQLKDLNVPHVIVARSFSFVFDDSRIRA